MSEAMLALSLCLPWLVFLGVVAVQAVPAGQRVLEKRKASQLKVRANVRKQFPPEAELRSLARSVIKRQIHPLVILADGTILDGECRYRGLMLEDPDHEVDVIVVDREPSAAEVTEIQLVSALHSSALAPSDQSTACREWLAANPGATAKDLAAKIDRSESMVSKLLSLGKCVPAVQEAAAEGKIGPKAWHQISLLPEAEQGGLLEMYLSGMPADQVASVVKKKRQTAAVPTAKASKVVCPLPSGVTVQVTGAAIDLPGVVEVLTDLLAQAKKGIQDKNDVNAFMAVLKAKAKK